MRIDTSTIPGYGEMSAEEKLKALEGMEIPAPDYSGYVKKDVFDKTASELAAKKKELNAKLTADEVKAREDAEAMEKLQGEYDALLYEVTLQKHKTQFLALGYEEKLSGDAARALAEGDYTKLFTLQAKHQTALENKVREQVLQATPKPDGGSGSSVMSKEQFMKLSPSQRHAYSVEHPDEYKEIYGGNK